MTRPKHQHDNGEYMNKDEKYKPIAEGARREMEAIREEILSPLENDIHKLRDPLVLAALMNSVATERENSNRLLKTLVERLDAKFGELDARLTALEGGHAAAHGAQDGEGEILLPAVDEEMLRFVKEKRHVSAEEVKRRFNYKGKNAASARLNKLFAMGLLSKRQVGRAVLYCAKQ